MAKKDSKLSPMMAQYFEVKSKYPDTILFFRVGDFYEMFFDDAKLASSELDLVLTGKDCGQEERAPMCGVPFHSADNYIAKLVSHGHKVAICEQTEDPSKATGLVKRDVIRVMTPGTVLTIIFVLFIRMRTEQRRACALPIFQQVSFILPLLIPHLFKGKF